ncbi:MAG: YjbQ family protein [Balneolales bacterium]
MFQYINFSYRAAMMAGATTEPVKNNFSRASFIESAVPVGFCHIFSVGSTASISTMEFEPALVKDIKEKLEDFASRDMKSHYSDLGR